MSTMNTGTKNIVVGAPGSPIFTPMTAALNSNDFRRVRFRMRGASSSMANPFAKPGVQFSNDGVTWDAAEAYGYSNAALPQNDWDWTSFDSSVPFGPSGATVKLFVRFGLFAEAYTGQLAGVAQAEMIVDVEHVTAATYMGGPKMVASSEDGATASPTFWPLTEWVPSTDIESVRQSMDIQSVSDAAGLEVAAGFQTANDRTDPATWTATVIGPAYLKFGLPYFGTAYQNVNGGASPDEAWIRFGVFAQDTGSGATTGPHYGLVELRIDAQGG